MNSMNYGVMADRLAQFRQPQVQPQMTGGGSNGVPMGQHLGNGFRGSMGQGLQSLPQQGQGMFQNAGQVPQDTVLTRPPSPMGPQPNWTSNRGGFGGQGVR
jgi:hypothetical protein